MESVPSYSQFGCIGAGVSAIALGATLKRWYGLEDIRFFDKQSNSGGTWWANTYPGCACDVPSALYSFSFAQNPDWTKLMPSSAEIKQYLDDVQETYGLTSKVTLSTEVYKCVWREDASRWLLFLRDVKSGHVWTHECQILLGATGQLVEPRPCDISGHESFKGAIFHSARWNHDVPLEGKNVVVIGNGCTASQIVPAVVNKVKSLTQIIRSQHWVEEAVNLTYPSALRWIFRNIPLVLSLHRFMIFLIAENDFRLFYMTEKAAKLRQNKRKTVEKYMRDTAPSKYHDILIPDIEWGCKRRIFDCGYLESLNHEKLLLTDAKIQEIVAEGIKTENGIISADVIVLATGFQTNKLMTNTVIQGRNGKTLEEHWSKYGGPEAYNCSVMSGFPNFFFLPGPNSATGHMSAIVASENSVNYALRILKPVLEGNATAVDIKQEAEDEYSERVQDALRDRVWNSGCHSWYITESKRNATAYPWSQAHYWYRSLFPVWSDWNIKWTKKIKSNEKLKMSVSLVMIALGSLYMANLRNPSLKASLVQFMRSTTTYLKI